MKSGVEHINFPTTKPSTYMPRKKPAMMDHYSQEVSSFRSLKNFRVNLSKLGHALLQEYIIQNIELRCWHSV